MTTKTSISFSEEEAERVKQLAKEQDRSVSGVLRQALKKAYPELAVETEGETEEWKLN